MAEPLFSIARGLVLTPARLWFRWRFEGLERIPAVGAALIACNHASYLDPIANACAIVSAGRRPRFLAKAELFKAPLIGWVLPRLGQIPVARGTGDRTPLQAAERALARGEVVVIYPEGTVTTRADGMPMEGKTGAVRLALSSGLPILPMVSWGSAPVWQKSGKGSLKYGRPVWVAVGDPIDFTARRSELGDGDAAHEMTADLMSVLTDMTVDLRDRYPPRWAARG